jgi:Ca-activated chloride channel family protein
MNGASYFEWAHPWALWGLLVVPLVAWCLRGARRPRAVRFSAPVSLHGIGDRLRPGPGELGVSLLLLVLVLGILAAARPRKTTVTGVSRASGVDIVLALDVSSSMLAEDFEIAGQRVNRLEAMRSVTKKFIEGRRSDRIGMVAFAGHPYLVSPLTLNHRWLNESLERLKIGLVEDGTAIGSALAFAGARLQDQPSKSKIIVLVTDGENTAGKVTPATAAEAARALGIKIHCIAAGTEDVAPYPVRDMFGNRRYEHRKFRVDFPALQKVAEIGGGKAFRATDTTSLEKIFGEIDTLEKTEVPMDERKQYHEYFPLLLGAAVLLALGHVSLSEIVGRRWP